MRGLVTALFLGTLLVITAPITGCGNKNIHSEAKLVTPEQKAREAYDKTTAALLAATRTVTSDFAADLYTVDEAMSLLEIIEKGNKAKKVAKLALDVGDWSSAEVQIGLANSALSYFEAELIKAKKEGK